MKNKLTVTVVDNQLVLSETRTIIQETELTRTTDLVELSTLIQTAGYKSATFSDEAKELKQSIVKAARVANNVKRQAAEAKRKERKIEQIRKLEEKLAKLRSA